MSDDDSDREKDRMMHDVLVRVLVEGLRQPQKGGILLRLTKGVVFELPWYLNKDDAELCSIFTKGKITTQLT